MSKETTPKKLGEVRFTDSEKEVIAAGIDSEFFRILEKKYLKTRIQRIALTALYSADEKTIDFHRGQAAELEKLVRDLRKIADDYNKKNLDPDTEG